MPYGFSSEKAKRQLDRAVAETLDPGEEIKLWSLVDTLSNHVAIALSRLGTPMGSPLVFWRAHAIALSQWRFFMTKPTRGIAFVGRLDWFAPISALEVVSFHSGPMWADLRLKVYDGPTMRLNSNWNFKESLAAINAALPTRP
jgi:hypothetical protein